MPNNKVLFIVEGENDEVSFIRRLLAKCGQNTEYEIYSYRCNIHVLAQVLYNDYPNFDSEEIDIQLVLSSIESNKNRQKMLKQRFRDIFLIFDFEPQHHPHHFDTIRRMLEYFNDSSDHGKLYINYPMMQSYKHFSSLPDDMFRDREVSRDECNHYKDLVGKMSKYSDINLYHFSTFVSLIIHHIRKANYLISGKYETPPADDYLKWDNTTIFDLQCRNWEENGKVYVLNTCIFIVTDFSPHYFFHRVSTHLHEFDI